MMGDWTFFSNYGHVLVCLARNHKARLRDVAQDVGITERAVQKIVRDLQDAGFVTVSKQGRCNRYRINRRKALRHTLESQVTVGKLLTLVAPAVRSSSAATRMESAEIDDQAAVQSSADGAESPPGKERKQQPEHSSKPEKASADTPAEGNDKEKDKSNGPIDVRQQGSLF